jgi:hypothetical protein
MAILKKWGRVCEKEREEEEEEKKKRKKFHAAYRQKTLVKPIMETQGQQDDETGVPTTASATFPPHDGLCGLAIVLKMKHTGCKDRRESYVLTAVNRKMRPSGRTPFSVVDRYPRLEGNYRIRFRKLGQGRSAVLRFCGVVARSVDHRLGAV